MDDFIKRYKDEILSCDNAQLGSIFKSVISEVITNNANINCKEFVIPYSTIALNTLAMIYHIGKNKMKGNDKNENS